jgi:hypothetical protein
VILLFVAGVGFGHMWVTRSKSLPAHVIQYKVTSYDKEGNLQVQEARYVTRFQHSDGRWRHHEVLPDGRSQDGSGHIVHLPANFAGEREDRILGYRVIEKRGNGIELWVAPELNDILRVVEYDSDGHLSSVMQAIDIQIGEPLDVTHSETVSR